MSERETPDASWDQEHHERWFAMKTAYNRYVNASAPLDDLMEELGDVQVKLLNDQRLAYEEYIEARLQFSESLLPRFGVAVMRRESKGPASLSRNESVTSKLARPALAITFLCLTALSLAYIRYGRPQDRDTGEAALSQTGNPLIPRSNASNPAQQVPTESGGGKAFVPICPAVSQAIQATAPERVAGQRWSRLPVSPLPRGKKSIGYARSVRLLRSGNRAYYEFTLKALPRFERIGPIQVSLRRVDRKTKDFDLSFLDGNFRIDERHIRLHEPLWIHLSGRAKPVQLVTDRIGKNDVHGYLCDFQCNQQQQASGPLRAGAGLNWQQLRPF